MDNALNRDFVKSVREVIQYCQSIEESLLQDKKDFVANQLDKVTESNDQKVIFLNQLSALTTDLSKSEWLRPYPGSLLNALEKYAISLNTTDKNEFEPLINELKQKITNCYQALAINNNIVYSNLKHLNTIWERLLSYRPKTDVVYDKHGKTSEQKR